MTTLNIKLNFLWDDGMPGVGQYLLAIPGTIFVLEVSEILQKEHSFLCKEDDEDRYGFCGRTPDTLLDYKYLVENLVSTIVARGCTRRAYAVNV